MTGSKPLISVCIANYNGEHLLVDCVESVLEQQVDAAVEIIVHDDASTDGSVRLLRARYPQVKLIQSSANVGFCLSNNRMVDQACGDYVLLLNNDAALLPGALSTLLTMAKRSGPCVLGLTQYDWESGDIVDRGSLLDPFYNPVPNLRPEREDVAYVIGACLWAPIATWRQLGGLPTWMGSIAEDMYFCCVARLEGILVQVPAGSGYRHRQGASFGGNRTQVTGIQSTIRRRLLSERNKTAVLFTCTPGLLAWPLLFVHLILLSTEGLLVALVNRRLSLWSDVYGSALVWFRTHFNMCLRIRRNLQARRTISICAYFKGFVPWPRKLQMLWKFGWPEVRP